VVAGRHLDRHPAELTELSSAHSSVGAEPVAARVREDRTPPASTIQRTASPARPAVRHVTGLALDQIAAEHLARVAAHAAFDQ
jgi:hypothetical protein